MSLSSWILGFAVGFLIAWILWIILTVLGDVFHGEEED